MYPFVRMTSLSFALGFYTFVTEQLLLLTKNTEYQNKYFTGRIHQTLAYILLN